VIWQGEDLPCIGLCTGDSISDVMYKLAVELCDLKNTFDFTDVDLTVILDICTASPEPAKTLTNILNLIMNKLACLSDIVAAIDNTPPDEPLLSLDDCFLPHLNGQGVPQTELPHSEYTVLIGIKVCDLVTELNLLDGRVTELEDKVQTLEDAGAYTPPTVLPSCLLSPVPTEMPVLIEAIEADYCNLVNALGGVSDIIAATTVPTICVSEGGTLGAQPSLSQSGLTLQNLTGWSNPVLNLANQIQNLFVMICDLRGAVKFIQDTCCKVTCDDLIVDFDAIATSNDNGEFILRLFFGKTDIPSTWYDCNQQSQTNTTIYPYGWTGNKLTITDSAGHTKDVYIQLRNSTLDDGILNDPTIIDSGYDIILENTSIIEGPLTITANICITDKTNTCVKCVSKDAVYVNTGCCTITNPSKLDSVTIIYSI
jgi:hypothetical protein